MHAADAVLDERNRSARIGTYEENRTVKRNLFIVAGVTVLGIAGYMRAQGQQQYNQVQPGIQQVGNTVAPIRTRVAVINLQSVIKQYKKWSNFETEYKQTYDSFNQEFERKKAEAASLKNQYEKAAADEQARDALQRQMRALDREVQDMGENAKKRLSKMRDDQASQIYREVEQAVEAFARANDIEMVLHYNDALTPEDKINSLNIQSKLQTRALFPMYVAPGMDITNTIALMLNQRFNGGVSAPSQPNN